MENEKVNYVDFRESFRRINQAKLKQRVEEEYKAYRKHINPVLKFCGKEFRRLLSYKILFLRSMMDFLTTTKTLDFVALDKLLCVKGNLLKNLWQMSQDTNLRFKGNDGFYADLFESFYYHDYMKAENAKYID